MSKSALNQQQRYTWADYQTWNDNHRWEIIGGDAYLMSPSPTSRHQWIVTELSARLHAHFNGKPCRLFVSPMDVVLSDEDVVQPDLLVVCNPSQIKRTHIEGAPALAVEIESSSSVFRDRLLKLNLYAQAGVKEYWIVRPWPSLVEVLLLQGAKYQVQDVFGKEQTLTSPSFPDLQINLADVFDFPLEPGEEPPIVKESPTPPYRAGQSKETSSVQR
jgi:Uma2 family endonuclease